MMMRPWKTWDWHRNPNAGSAHWECSVRMKVAIMAKYIANLRVFNPSLHSFGTTNQNMAHGSGGSLYFKYPVPPPPSDTAKSPSISLFRASINASAIGPIGSWLQQEWTMIQFSMGYIEYIGTKYVEDATSAAIKDLIVWDCFTKDPTLKLKVPQSCFSSAPGKPCGWWRRKPWKCQVWQAGLSVIQGYMRVNVWCLNLYSKWRTAMSDLHCRLGSRCPEVLPLVTPFESLPRNAKTLSIPLLCTVHFYAACWEMHWNGYGSIPINTIFSGMNIHLPAILGFTRYQGFDPSPNGIEVSAVSPR